MQIKKYFLFVFALLVTGLLSAQTESPATWKYSLNQVENDIYEVRITGILDGNWHIYDLGPYEGGPNQTSLVWETGNAARLIGKPAITSTVHRGYDDIFMMDIGTCESPVIIVQKIQLTGNAASEVVLTLEYQACDDSSCLPPMEQEFRISLPAAINPTDQENPAKEEKTAPRENPTKAPLYIPEPIATEPIATEPIATTPIATEAIATEPIATEAIATNPIVAGEEVSAADNSSQTAQMSAKTEKDSSIWAVILEAILWGFVALLTPCVFPMVPMTVSFFLKSSGQNKGRGRMMASLYGISIVFLYTLPIAIIILVTYIFGGQSVTADIFNWIATHWLPNLLFFAIFMIFAASFFGAFEITLPSSLVNRSDKNSDKGGLLGVFFMAMTLVLVSFSCTGPIVGSILIKSTQGEIWEPIITMLAFSIAFALPFTIFAFVPSLLKNLPKSGGWLNSVKVVLGFIEVALGFKFLSVADQTYHWGLMDREVYLAVWIVVFSLLGLYLLGKIRFANDSPIQHLSVLRLSLVIAVFSFVVYMIPGMWGAPLKALSGYLPPITSQDFVLSAYNGGGGYVAPAENRPSRKAPKYSDFLHLPFNLQGYFDMEEGRAYAKETGKPMFVAFTGHGCVNCREMEARVWSDSRVQDYLRNKYVIVSLFADDKKQVDEASWLHLEDGKVLKTLGKINSHLALTKFGVNAQPYYVLLDPSNDQALTTPRGYNLDVEAFIDFLQAGLDAYEKIKN